MLVVTCVLYFDGIDVVVVVGGILRWCECRAGGGLYIAMMWV